MARTRPGESKGASAAIQNQLREGAGRDSRAVPAVSGSARERGQEPSSQDGIARRAYEIYCERGCEDGHDMEDWFQAERELRGQTE
jgi:hypothetical protein